MPIHIKSLETERLAREIADRTDDSITGAIKKSLEERLERIKQQRRTAILSAQLEEIVERVRKMPVLDSRTPEEIIGYDEHGIPR